jgi:uncharacterized membrane protein YebE (DUF533 family)
MDTINKSKWQVRGAALLIFVLGFAAGALAFNAYKRWDRSRGEQSRQERFENSCKRFEKSKSPESTRFASRLMNACKR